MARTTSKVYSIEDLLEIYNSVRPSRTRWVRNRNDLRNKWSELFVALEKMSGRNGLTATVYDPNWHKLTDNGVKMRVDSPVSSPQIKKTNKEWSDKNLVA